ncbi:hypothetical protein [Variovorax sp. IB41]|uniref:hypothetical protein n=1 Tax=Variovorax sp. IB41 TaxID=2779370 RepID=UPI0018E88830|nr:hypothetical protein [Variovorax sp. IB41]MBJ2155145.1 hypothetical protein [Variovorax sp. IB41]
MNIQGRNFEAIMGSHQELSSLGVVFNGLPEQQPCGGVLATLRVPAGNELQLVQQSTVDHDL